MSETPQAANAHVQSMSAEVLAARQLHKSFRASGAPTVTVLQDVDLVISAGEAVTISGASGSGKSTLLHLLGGLDTPDSGEVRLLGKRFDMMSATGQGDWRNRHLGFVYQFHHLLPEFTAQENVAMPLLIRRTTREEAMEAASNALADVGLAARVTHRPGELSGGERQRTAIARALVCKPACILADEPTGNLDQHTAAGVFELLQEQCHHRHASLLLVTHDPALAKQTHRLLNLSDGVLTGG